MDSHLDLWQYLLSCDTVIGYGILQIMRRLVVRDLAPVPITVEHVCHWSCTTIIHRIVTENAIGVSQFQTIVLNGINCHCDVVCL